MEYNFALGDLVRVDDGSTQYVTRYSPDIEGTIHPATSRQKADWLTYTERNGGDAMPLISTSPIYNYQVTNGQTGDELEEWEELGHSITILGGQVTININYGKED